MKARDSTCCGCGLPLVTKPFALAAGVKEDSKLIVDSRVSEVGKWSCLYAALIHLGRYCIHGVQYMYICQEIVLHVLAYHQLPSVVLEDT